MILELHFRRLHWRPNRLIQSRELFGHFLVHRDFSSPVQQRNWIWSNNNYLYFKHYFQLFDLVQSDWDRTHHFWSFLGFAVRCLKKGSMIKSLLSLTYIYQSQTIPPLYMDWDCWHYLRSRSSIVIMLRPGENLSLKKYIFLLFPTGLVSTSVTQLLPKYVICVLSCHRLRWAAT